MKQPFRLSPPELMKSYKEIIFAQRGLLLCIRRTAFWLFEHELTRIDPRTGNFYTNQQAFENVMAWMAEQSAILERVKREPTQMQRRLLQMLADGKSQKQIALELGKNLSTTAIHFARLRKRLGADTMYQVMAISVKKGWIKVRSEQRQGLGKQKQ